MSPGSARRRLAPTDNWRRPRLATSQTRAVRGIAFLFDLDGVLADTHQIVIDGWRRFSAARGRQFSDDEIVERMFGRRTIDILVELFGIPAAEAATLATQTMDDKRAEVEGRRAVIAPVAGAPEFVRATIAAGIPSAVVSSASGANVQLALEHIGLDGAFAAVVSHSHVKHGKPAPDPYLAGAAALGFAPSQCVVFEDTPAGIAAAKAAGSTCVGVASLGRPDMVAAADLVISDFRGLAPEDVLSRLAPRVPPAALRGARSRDMSTAGDEGEHQS